MNQYFAVLLLVAVAISKSDAADANHQEQDFLTCGHHLTKAQCDTYASDNGGKNGAATAADAADKPYGCYKIPADPVIPVVLEFVFNSNATAKSNAVACTAANPCICDKLVGGFDTSAVLCNSQGYQPTFTYNPGTQTQDVTVDIKLGNGVTTSGAALNADGEDERCFSSKNGTTDAKTVTSKIDFDSSAWANQISFGTVAVPTCGGALTHETVDAVEKIQYEIDAEAIVTRKFRTRKIQRQRKYTFKIKCLMTRAVTASSTNGFTVAAALIEANKEEDVSEEFSFSASLKFYNEGYAQVQSNTLEPNNNQKVYVQVEKGADQDLFVFAVQKCYATTQQSLVGYSGAKDNFFVNECPVDETLDFSVEGQKFRFEIQAFSFTGADSSSAVFLHCDLQVCLADGSTKEAECAQNTKADCASVQIANNRRRRDITSESLATGSRYETITATQPILLEGSQFHAPGCGEGFVYDRVSQECSRVNLMEVKGIRLSGDHFNVDYYNTSSKAFKDMAKEKEFLLWVLIRTSGQSETIRGIQVTGARPGGVTLDVVIRHSDSVTPAQAFAIFKEEVVGAPARVTRVQNVLQITEKRDIQYLQVVGEDKKSDSEKLILIVVIAVLFVVVFIAGVTLFKVKQIRRQASNPQPTAGFENKGIDA